MKLELRRVDLLLAVVLAVMGGVEAAARAELDPHAISVPAAAAAGLVLALRRVRPLVTTLAFMGLFAAQTLLDLHVEEGLAFFAELVLVVFSVAAYGSLRGALAGLAATLAAAWTSVAAASPDSLAEDLVFSGIVALTPWIAGRAFHGRHRRATEMERRSAELELRREPDMRAAVAEERARIARELHDVIAHTVSVMGVQASAAAEVLRSDPERARESLGAIEQSAREAVHELRRLLDVLRESGDAVGMAPQPGLGQLELLIEQVRRTGLDVELHENGTAARLSPGVELAAYRVVQEALTNVVKHARATRAWVSVRREPKGVQIEVADDGAGLAAGRERVGHGLIGMRERAALYGGTLDAGPAPEGGWRVVARLRDEGGQA